MVNLPLLKKICLVGFSLYKRANGRVEIDIDKNVFCLAGANGIGKSTFLNAVHFAITGIVPDPKRAFLYLDKYTSDNARFSNDYFSGRIVEMDRDIAEVHLTFEIGDYLFDITRPVFSPSSLSA